LNVDKDAFKINLKVNIMHNKRQITIIKTLLKCKSITIRELAILCNASYKSIQNDLAAVREELRKNGAVISSDSWQGISLGIQDPGQFWSYYDKELSHNTELLTNDDYCELFLYLLAVRDYMKLDDFMEIFYVSRTKVSQILKNAKEVLSGYLVEIVSRPRYGLFLKGDEIAVRQMLVDIIYGLEQKGKLKLLERLDPGREEVCREVEDILNSALEQTAFPITDTSLHEVRMVLYVSSVRIGLKKHVVYTESEMQYLERSPEYTLAALIGGKMDALGECTGKREEIVFLAQLLCGRRKYKLSKGKRQEYLETELSRIAERIIRRIKEKYEEDFREDLDLYTSLLGHLIALTGRIQTSLYTRNPLLLQIRKNYPFAFEMGIESACVIYEESGVFIDENEIGYIALYFETAMERRNVKESRKKILIVCSSGGGLAQLLALKVKHNFGSSIETIETRDQNSLKGVDMSGFDYVFSAVPLEGKIPVPYFKISSILSQEDIQKMEVVFQEKESVTGLADLLSEDCFFTDIRGGDRREIIGEICRRLRNVLSLPENFEQEVYERENLVATELGNFTAFPHPLNVQVEQSFMSVTVLEEPILWEKEMVQVIFLGMTKKGESKKLQKMYQEFAELITDNKKILRLIQTKTFAALRKLLEE